METMTAVVFRGKDRLVIEDVPRPHPRAGQAVIRITTTTICGTDVHIVRGEYPVQPGLILGHEPVGVVEELGEGLRAVPVGRAEEAPEDGLEFVSGEVGDAADRTGGHASLQSTDLRGPTGRGSQLFSEAASPGWTTCAHPPALPSSDARDAIQHASDAVRLSRARGYLRRGSPQQCRCLLGGSPVPPAECSCRTCRRSIG